MFRKRTEEESHYVLIINKEEENEENFIFPNFHSAKLAVKFMNIKVGNIRLYMRKGKMLWDCSYDLFHERKKK
jgi:hypothetical protein